jgi:hypothetical protein
VTDQIKICVFGNSHAASLKMGWELIAKEYESVDLIFFAQRNTGLSGLVVRDGLLVPNSEWLKKAIVHTSGGLECVNFNDFGFSLLYGLDLHPYFVKNDQFFSRSALALAAKDRASETVSMKLLQKIRMISDIKVFVGHCPLPSVGSGDPSVEPAGYDAGIEIMNELVLYGYNAVLLGQPRQTIVNGRHTDKKYSSGSRRLDIGDSLSNKIHEDSDNVHMNENFGALYLKEFLDIVVAGSSATQQKRMAG